MMYSSVLFPQIQH